MADEEPVSNTSNGGGNQDPNADGDKSNQQNHDDKSKKVEFDPEQQAIVNRLIKESIGKGFDKAQAMMAEELKKRDDKIAELVQRTEQKPAKKSDDSSDDPVKQFKAQIAELTTALETVRKDKDDIDAKLKDRETRAASMEKKEKIRSLVPSDMKFFDFDSDVYPKIESQIVLNDQGKWIVLNPETGTEAKNKHFDPMSVAEFIAEFATRKPWLVESPNQDGGTGQQESRRTKTNADSKTPWANVGATSSEFEKIKSEVKSKG